MLHRDIDYHTYAAYASIYMYAHNIGCRSIHVRAFADNVKIKYNF